MELLYIILALFALFVMIVIFALMKAAAMEDEQLENDEMLSTQLEALNSAQEECEQTEVKP